jgi:hypothetical protein
MKDKSHESKSQVLAAQRKISTLEAELQAFRDKFKEAKIKSKSLEEQRITCPREDNLKKRKFLVPPPAPKIVSLDDLWQQAESGNLKEDLNFAVTRWKREWNSAQRHANRTAAEVDALSPFYEDAKRKHDYWSSFQKNAGHGYGLGQFRVQEKEIQEIAEAQVLEAKQKQIEKGNQIEDLDLQQQALSVIVPKEMKECEMLAKYGRKRHRRCKQSKRKGSRKCEPTKRR